MCRQFLRTLNCGSFGQCRLFIDGAGSAQLSVSLSLPSFGCELVSRIRTSTGLFGSVFHGPFRNRSDCPRVHLQRVSVFQSGGKSIIYLGTGPTFWASEDLHCALQYNPEWKHSVHKHQFPLPSTYDSTQSPTALTFFLWFSV